MKGSERTGACRPAMTGPSTEHPPAPLGVAAAAPQAGLPIALLCFSVLLLLAPAGALAQLPLPTDCTIDMQGADDEPGQKDLTELCHSPGDRNPFEKVVSWNHDDTGFSGGNTGDSCALFDTDGNLFADFALCVTLENGTPALQEAGSPRFYSCGDDRPDKCTGEVEIASFGSTCWVNSPGQGTDPFASDPGHRNSDCKGTNCTNEDTFILCGLELDDVAPSAACIDFRCTNTGAFCFSIEDCVPVTDVCSYPSQNPHSDPSDCVITPTAQDPCQGVDCSFLDDDCNVGVCDSATGSCFPDPKVDGTQCEDGVACTSADGTAQQPDQCIRGACKGIPVDCSGQDDDCNVGVCNETTGACEKDPTPKQGDSCQDGDLCTSFDGGVGNADECRSGVCTGDPVDCSSEDDACNLGVCNETTGVCEKDPTPKEGTSCEDGDVCTSFNGTELKPDECRSGVCTGDPVDCSSEDDDCNLGVCNATTGACEKDPTPKEGDPCQDGNVCTSFDSGEGNPDECRSGLCAGDPVDCSSEDDDCNVGFCNATTGACEKDPTPKEGDACEDGNVCTSDTTVPQSPDKCVGGACVGSAVDCSAEDDDCNAGVCNATSGACEKDAALKEGDPCEDGDPCTSATTVPQTPDECAGGACVGSAVDCSAEDATCRTGVCNATTGLCEGDPTPNVGGPCQDGNACTSFDGTPGNPDECSIDGVCTGIDVDPGSPPPADFIIIIDNSRSMVPDLSRPVPNAFDQFPAALDSAGIDWRVAVIRFATNRIRNPVRGDRFPDLLLPLTNDAAAFQAALDQMQQVSQTLDINCTDDLQNCIRRKTEAGCEAIELALTPEDAQNPLVGLQDESDLRLRDEAICNVILYTDEDDDNGATFDNGATRARRKREPPRKGADCYGLRCEDRWEDFQQRYLFGCGQLLVERQCQLNLIINPRNRPSKHQYGIPACTEEDTQGRLDKAQTFARLSDTKDSCSKRKMSPIGVCGGTTCTQGRRGAACATDSDCDAFSLQMRLLGAGRCVAGVCEAGRIGSSCNDDFDCSLMARTYRLPPDDQVETFLANELIPDKISEQICPAP